MGLIKPADKVTFATDSLEEAFNSLKEEDWLKKAILKAISNIKQNIFCGENIPKRLIPRDYIQKYNVENLYWYPLPNSWRLVYSIFTNEGEIRILAVIVDYYDHKNYERKFHY